MTATLIKLIRLFPIAEAVSVWTNWTPRSSQKSPIKYGLSVLLSFHLFFAWTFSWNCTISISKFWLGAKNSYDFVCVIQPGFPEKIFFSPELEKHQKWAKNSGF